MLRRLADAPLTRSRAYTVIVVTVISVLVLQMITTVAGAVLAGRQFENASIDTFEYVGELTVERVARYSMGARDVVNGTVNEFELLGPDIDRDELEASLSRRLLREEAVRGLYVGWPDGEYMVLRREAGGFISQRGDPESGDPSELRVFDYSFNLVDTTTFESDYDPRTRPWYLTGTTSGVARWTSPYLEFDTSTTLVSVAQSARADGRVTAVVGADLGLDGLTRVLDELPYGEGAEAFVLSRDLAVIAAPSEYDEALTAVIGATGDVPHADEIGIDVNPVMVKPGESRFSRDLERITLDRGFPLSETVPWRLHMVASEQELSAGLGGLGTIVLWITAFSFLAVAVVSGVVWWVRRPLGRLREQAMTDPLTGLLNRHEFYRQARHLARRAVEQKAFMMVTALDLDDFKQVNDEWGHDAGDQVLVAVASGLRESARASDLTARLGGDEFVVLNTLHAGDDSLAIAQRVRDAVEKAIHARAPGASRVGVTAGVATSAHAGEDITTLVTRADQALIYGKRETKGRVYMAPDDGAAPPAR